MGEWVENCDELPKEAGEPELVLWQIGPEEGRVNSASKWMKIRVWVEGRERVVELVAEGPFVAEAMDS